MTSMVGALLPPGAASENTTSPRPTGVHVVDPKSSVWVNPEMVSSKLALLSGVGSFTVTWYTVSTATRLVRSTVLVAFRYTQPNSL